MRYLLLFWLCLSFACQQKIPESSTISSTNDSDQVEEVRNPKSIEALWHQLVFEEGGCLTGGQFVVKKSFGDRLCVMTQSKGWQEFFGKDSLELHAFLVEQFSDTTSTQIHTCPFFNASVGEVAVYSLQNIYKLNWFDLPGFTNYQNVEAMSAEENHQAWLQQILADEEQRLRMQNDWQALGSK